MKTNRRQPILATSLMISLSAICSAAFAETYKCDHHGAVTYSQTPCAEGIVKPMHLTVDKVSSADYQMGLKEHLKEQAEVKKLQNNRHREEAKYAREMRVILAKNERQKEKCDALQAKVKWAKEDLSNAHPKAESKARFKLKRATEKAALSCKTR